MLQLFVPLARQALTEPREAASTLLSMGVPKAAYWPAFFALVALSVILNEVVALMTPGPAIGPQIAPLVMAALTALISAVSVWAIWKVGRAMGGTGSFDEALLLTIFLQAILFTGQLVEVGLMLILPPIAGLFSVALIILAFWLNVNFVAALHGFTSLWRAFGALILATLGVALVLIFLMTLTGIGPGMGGGGNV
ncbi:hypothetical protein GQ651_06995 [Alphaproteobacteria bacterium GH1-50]|uniref:Yip1 domain-containing protein n=1 Tax=Kangsaoukella pontilimi TaxID=2691042 RepID=A0A7C9IFV6_9RHOB|nr:YIP1 family protein [Kangsaoukella pontilimi]MXQ07589.1 hypothetical protein [Kangsaoukella pontilimi]